MIHTLVRDWMTKDPITVEPNTTITEAYSFMIEQRIRRLPVVDNEKLVGIVTLSDLYQVRPFDQIDTNSLTISQELNNMVVEEVMAPGPITTQDDATVGEAAQKMLESKISGLPVIDPTGCLVGIITESDIFRLVVQEWSTRRHGSLHMARRPGQG